MQAHQQQVGDRSGPSVFLKKLWLCLGMQKEYYTRILYTAYSAIHILYTV